MHSAYVRGLFAYYYRVVRQKVAALLDCVRGWIIVIQLTYFFSFQCSHCVFTTYAESSSCIEAALTSLVVDSTVTVLNTSYSRLVLVAAVLVVAATCQSFSLVLSLLRHC